jgi:hypothetical protein
VAHTQEEEEEEEGGAAAAILKKTQNEDSFLEPNIGLNVKPTITTNNTTEFLQLLSAFMKAVRGQAARVRDGVLGGTKGVSSSTRPPTVPQSSGSGAVGGDVARLQLLMSFSPAAQPVRRRPRRARAMHKAANREIGKTQKIGTTSIHNRFSATCGSSAVTWE